MPTIAIVGAGPGLGLAIAKKFGSESFKVALIARNQEKLDALAADLAGEGISASGFAGDVLDRPSLKAALAAAKAHFGSIDVLEYSPSDRAAGQQAPVHVSLATPENVQPQIEYYLYGAMAATEVVLHEMLEAKAGTLLFTTGGGSIYPVPHYGNVTAGAAALRNWSLNLGAAIAESGVHIAHVAISLFIGESSPIPGRDFMPASEIAELYWNMHVQRNAHELVVKK